MLYLKYNQTTGEIEGQVGFMNSNDPDVIGVDPITYSSFISPKINTITKTVIEGVSRVSLEASAIQIAKNYRDALWNTGSPLYNGKSYFYSDNLKGVVQAINSTAATSIPDPRSWQADDGTIVSLSHTDFMNIGIAEITRRDTIFARYVVITTTLIPSASPTAWTNTQLNQFIQNPSSLW